MPLVSIIMTSFNYADYISAAINSILAQSYTNWELIIIDDGSKDNSLAIINEFVNLYPNKIKLYVHENQQNKGIKASIELGLQKTNGSYIAFCESDDLYMQDNLKHKIEKLENNPNCILAYSKICLLGSAPQNMLTYINGISFFGKYYFNNGNYFDFRVLKFNPIGTFTNIVVRANDVKGIVFDKTFEAWCDLQLITYLANKCKFCFVNMPLIQWRIHDKSQNIKIKNSAFFKVFKDRFYNKYKVNKTMFKVNSIYIYALKVCFIILQPRFAFYKIKHWALKN